MFKRERQWRILTIRTARAGRGLANGDRVEWSKLDHPDRKMKEDGKGLPANPQGTRASGYIRAKKLARLLQEKG